MICTQYMRILSYDVIKNVVQSSQHQQRAFPAAFAELWVGRKEPGVDVPSPGGCGLCT